MSTYYLDTCALKWRYLNGPATSVIDNIVNDPSNRVLISTLTLLEWSSAFGVLCRTNTIDHQTFKANERAFMGDIHSGRLIPVPQSRVIEKARLLIEYIGVLNRRGLKTGDSIQLVTAKESAYAQQSSIEFVTSDQALASIVQDFNIFHPYLISRYISPL